MTQLGETFSKLELKSASDLLNTIVPNEPLRDSENSFEGNHRIYNSAFDGSLMRHGLYNHCQFLNVNFCGTVGNNSVFKNSRLNNCNIKNSNFTYSNFTNSELEINSISTTYDFSDCSGVTISKSVLEASSFKECYFSNSKIQDSEICNCEFSKSTFYNCFFGEIDLSVSTLDYSEFVNPVFHNVILPFFGLLNLVSGFNQIVNQENVYFKPASSGYVVSSEEYIENIRMLKPVFFYENNFLALANIYAYDGEIENSYTAILNGLKNACETLNFSLIRHLCRFASLNHYFHANQLKKFYELLEENLNIEKLGYVEYRNYLNELYLAKNMLIDCPFNRDIIEIELKTNFSYHNAEKLAETFRIINTTIDQYAPDSNNHITVRHNSPPDITIILSDNIYVLYLTFIAFQLIFCKSLNGIEKLQNVIKTRHEIRLQKLEEEMKKLEIEKLKSEIGKKEETHSILLPSDFDNITYIIKTAADFPKELRKM